MQSIVFDLDGTICIPNLDEKDTHRRYALAKPIQEVIDKMHKLKYNYRIVIHTARRMVTHNGDINKIIEDVGQVTEDWLSAHGVPYDELVWGKPYASSYYVDDKAMSVKDFLLWETT